ncbi:MAG TPA: DUF6362 family protein [Kaistia sp.]|jgi:hypothetical protein|nr:DUF6362 family protein [Kaistia sp.]
MGKVRAKAKFATRQEVMAELCGIQSAEHLGTSFWFEHSTPPDWIEPEYPTRLTRVSYPRQINDGTRGRVPHCWELATITEIVKPWEPSLGELLTADNDDDVLNIPAVWTEDHVRARLAETMETLRMCPGHWPAGAKSSMPDVVRSAVEAYGYGDAPVRRKPTAAELARLDYCLPWLFLIGDVARRKAVAGVAQGLNLRAIGKVIGCSHTYARTLEKQGIAIITERLNAGSS